MPTATPVPTAAADLFEKASRLKLRYPSSHGLLAIEDLWDLPLTSPSDRLANLDSIAMDLHRQTSAAGEVVSFVTEKPPAANAEALLGFEIVKHIIAVRLAEKAEAEAIVERRHKKTRLMELIAQKQDEALAGKSIEELLALAESM